ncbi:MAG: hypothetical protein Q9183_003657 [Haloplaca sp. 2 TL-2023]
MTKIDAAGWTFPQISNADENDRVSVDHAYELSFLKSFMESIIDKTNGIKCKDANAQFFDQGSCPANRMEPIYGSLPSYTNPDFVAMSQWLNGDAKRFVLGPDYKPDLGGSFLPGTKVRPFDNWSSALGKIKNKMIFAQLLVGAALIINADNTIPAMQTTNNRIYAAFKAYDTYLNQNRGLPRANFGWAAAYKRYMDKYIADRNQASRKGLGPLLESVGNDLNAARNVAGKVQSELDQWTNLHRSMTNYYTGTGAGVSQLNWEINWEWDAGSVKRSELENPIFRRQACERPTTTTSRQSTGEPTDDASTTSTGSGDEDEDEPTQTPSATPPEVDSTATATSSVPPSQTCFFDQDCPDDYECSFGDDL